MRTAIAMVLDPNAITGEHMGPQAREGALENVMTTADAILDAILPSDEGVRYAPPPPRREGWGRVHYERGFYGARVGVESPRRWLRMDVLGVHVSGPDDVVISVPWHRVAQVVWEAEE